MDREIIVYVDIENAPVVVGRLSTRVRGGNDSATLEYYTSWIRNAYHFSLEPALTIGAGLHHTAEGRTSFGAIGDSCPDRWGRALIKRAERKQAEKQSRPPRASTEAQV